jgi:Lrp/AsnC family leucine-responsive transcriptional regulator
MTDFQDKDIAIIKLLRKNARTNLVKIAYFADVPKSTVFDRIKKLEQGVISKHTTLVDFEKLGFNARYIFMVKCSPDGREKVREFLSNNPSVNNLYITNSDFDFLFEAVFKDNKEMSDFKESISANLPLMRLSHYELIKDLHRERFLEE